ncbi:MAG: hypothetical protein AABW58_04775, partial [Nanoarchaeota archaeon]
FILTKNLFKQMKSMPFLLAFILISSIVFAAGGGGGGSSRSVVPLVKETPLVQEKQEEIEKPCNDRETRFERINCRLQKPSHEINTIEESCRVFSDPANCQNSYRKVLPCYDIKGPEKNKCFKKFAFENENAVVNSQNKQQIRNYMVYLLYDIQEKVEEAFEENKISSQEAAVVIDLIIKIKQDLFIKKSKTEIKPEIEDLKTKIKNLNLE